MKFQSLDAAQEQLTFSKQSSTPTVSTVQSDLSLGPRPNMSTPDTIQSCDLTISREQVSACGIQFGTNNCLKEDKYKGLFPSTEVLSSGTQYSQLVFEPKKSWKKCSTHVYIARLINDFQKSARKDGLLQKPIQLTTNGGIEQQPHVSIDNQNRDVRGPHGVLPFNGFTHSASEKDSADIKFPILSHKRLLHDHRQASQTPVLCSSLKQGSDFLSLAPGGCGSDANDGINTAGYSREAFKQFHFSYEQSQKHSAVFLSLSQNGCSSTFHSRSSSAAAAPQVHVPPYTYSSAGFAGPHLQDWQNGGRDAQALFPHLHSVLGSKYQRSSPQQQQLMPVNSSFLLPRVERHNRHLNPAYERNSTTLQSDNILQLQLLCHKNL
ncbi:hypothetical protein CDL12_18482 [Handroanthus impetiginosus]|uniref:Uncharacterized protein n=1 Tax=Handroanthus impetiginosus TaxID=429701 RepID=A0A2G9GUP4_9LAMI|nr:hypothetical protein CDL12_18482 [Handroanthus impetiginosus]